MTVGSCALSLSLLFSQLSQEPFRREQKSRENGRLFKCGVCMCVCVCVCVRERERDNGTGFSKALAKGMPRALKDHRESNTLLLLVLVKYEHRHQWELALLF